MSIKYDLDAIPEDDHPGFTREIRKIGDKIHCEHGPAIVVINADGEIIERGWYRNGHLFREGSPAEIINHENEYKEKWWPPRSDGPSFIVKVNDILIHEDWKSPKGFHRIDGPAMITRDRDTGVVTSEHWFRNGRTYRENGYASTFRDAITGEITCERDFFKNGKRLKPDQIAPKLN